MIWLRVRESLSQGGYTFSTFLEAYISLPRNTSLKCREWKQRLSGFCAFLIFKILKLSVILWRIGFSQEFFWRRVPLLLSSVQFRCSVVSDSLWPHESQHTRSPCPSPTPGVYSKLMLIESVMPASHLILCRPLLLPPIPPSIRVFSNESTLPMRWPMYWSFSFSISPSNDHPGLISLGWTGWISLQSKESQESSPTP